MQQGTIIQVIGPVVDVEFAEGATLPNIHDALAVAGKDGKLVAEVHQHLGGNRVRAVAMGTTDGVARGTAVVATGSPIEVPVGQQVLGRMFNVLGQVIDGKEAFTPDHMRVIHRQAPSFEEQSTKAEVFETGIKSIDLIIVPTQYKDVELTELGALQAFVIGQATGDHWNHLAECRNVLMYGAGHRREQARIRQEDIAPFVEILALCDRAKAALLSVRDREQKTGRFGLSGPEKEVISGLVATSADFWRQQPVWFFGECVKSSRARAHTLIQPKAKS